MSEETTVENAAPQNGPVNVLVRFKDPSGDEIIITGSSEKYEPNVFIWSDGNWKDHPAAYQSAIRELLFRLGLFVPIGEDGFIYPVEEQIKELKEQITNLENLRDRYETALEIQQMAWRQASMGKTKPEYISKDGLPF